MLVSYRRILNDPSTGGPKVTSIREIPLTIGPGVHEAGADGAGSQPSRRSRYFDGCHQVEPDPAKMTEPYGAETTVPEWCARLVCGECGGRPIDTERRIRP